MPGKINVRATALRATLAACGLAVLCVTARVDAAHAQGREAGVPPRQERMGLDSLFGQGMVLQRDQPIRVWGRAAPGEAVTLKLGSETASARADDRGRWHATFSPRAAGGPYVLDASAPSFHDRYSDILIGEVWLCSGQSNMEFQLSRSASFADGFAPDDKLRFLDVARRQDRAPSPHLMTLGPWTRSSSTAAAGFSAVCHGFGQKLRAALGVPVGLIDAAWGGTRIAAFVDEHTLRARGLTHPSAANPASRQNDARVFNGMIAPLAPLSLRGVLWYQGEANAHHPAGYADELAALAASWRRAFDRALPLLVIQLPAFHPPKDPPGTWAVLRDEQRKFVASDANADLIVLVDQGEPYNIHPTHKRVVADRAASVALAHVYHRNVAAHGPVPKSIRRQSGSVIIEYANAETLKVDGDGSVPGFSLCADRCVPASAKVEGNNVRLAIPAALKPGRVRYGWSDVPDIRLFNEAHLPAEPFDLPIE